MTLNSKLNSIWRALTSVRLTLTILSLLMLLCVVGTLVAQQGQTQAPIETLYSQQVFRLLFAMGLTDVFHSPYFVGLLLAWALNLMACSVERLPRIWRETFYVSPPPVQEPELDGWTPERARSLKYIIERPGGGKFQTVAEAKHSTELFFQKHFGRYEILRDSPDQFQISVEQQKYSRLGVYITHLSLLLIMTGGVIGAMLGFEGSMSIEEGTRVSWMNHLKGTNAGMRMMFENGLPVKGLLNLGFEVECEKFALETYDGSRPKAFRSHLNFYENDVKVYEADISVNHPTVFKGITFYQASYQDLGLGKVTLKVFRNTPKNFKLVGHELSGLEKGDKPERIDDVRLGEMYRIDSRAGFRVTKLEPNLMDLGPAVQIEYFKDAKDTKPSSFWVLKNLPGFDFAHRTGAPVHFVLEDVRSKFATGLSIARDPGVWVVWIGSLILIGALFMALYTCHRRYWIAYSKERGFAFVGWSNKLFLFENRFIKTFEDFKKEIA